MPKWTAEFASYICQAITDISPKEENMQSDGDIMRAFYRNLPEHVCDNPQFVPATAALREIQAIVLLR